MAIFEYRALDGRGKSISGLKEADSPKTLRTVLRRDGIFLTEVTGEMSAAERAANPAGSGVDLRKLGSGRIGSDDIAVVTRQLATLLGAGVNLVESLNALVDQVEKERLKRVLSDVKQKVNEGSSLAGALEAHQKIFGALYVNMIRAGEHSGALDAVLQRLADFTEGQAKLRQKIIGALIYPAIMMVIGGGILTLLLTVVVPKVTKIFETMKATLPWTTQLLIWGSNILQSFWFILFPAIIFAIVSFLRWIRSPTGKPIWDRKVLQMPVFGNLARMLAIARFTRTLSTLLKSGVPLLNAMDIVKNVVSNTILSDVIQQARDAIREGESIAHPLKRSGEFPPLVYHMVSIGEKSGQLEEMLVNIANNYETQVDVRIGAMTALLEPVMIVVMGGVIAFVAFSILMPILQINTVIH